jgi:putative MATE family efflux protein
VKTHNKPDLHPDLHNAPIGPLIVKLTTPLMLAGFLTTTYSFADMIFASRLGSVQVASIAFIAPLFIMLQSIVMGISSGGVSVIAKLIGQGEKEQAGAYATELRQLILISSFAFAFGGLLLSHKLLSLMQISGDMFEQSLIYTRIMFFSLPATAVMNLYMTLYMSQGKMKISSQISLLGLIFNVILNSIAIYILELGIDGLAYATLVSKILLAIIIVILYHNKKHDFSIQWRCPEQFRAFSIRKHLIKVGAPLSFSLASVHFGTLLINVIIAPYGYEVVAAFAIGNQINSLMFMPTNRMGQGIVPLIAQNWGANAMARVRTSIKYSLIYAAVIGVIAALIIQIIKWPLGNFLAKDDTIVFGHVINYVSLVGWTVIAWAVFNILQRVFESFQKTSFVFWINIVRLWGIRVPGILIFARFFPSLEEYGVWYTMFISNMATMVFALIFFTIKIPPVLNQTNNQAAVKTTEDEHSATS